MKSAWMALLFAGSMVLSGCGAARRLQPPGAAEQPSRSAMFPPEAVDHLRMAIDLEVEIFGLGRDASHLEGDVVVHRSGSSGPDGKVMVADLVAASLRGESKTFGPLVAIESPIQHSRAQYRWEGPRRYPGYFDINAWFFIPKHDLIVFTRKPVRVGGTASGIPPIGQVAEALDVPVELYDFRKPDDQPVGNLLQARGEILREVGIDEELKEEETTVFWLKGK
jgi:hypothetical protein